MKKIIRETSIEAFQRIIYGFGFGLGMSGAFKFTNNNNKNVNTIPYNNNIKKD